ncbi:ImcF-related family protein, partial [Paraburkholderia fungorum]|uniref:ImcF-related family protein n=1 Tax=Paraburkholderia fungorum TaxID=134537 RepID=UPI0038BD3FDB
MTKFRLTVFSYLLVAIAAGGLIWFKGNLFHLDTEAKRALAIIVLCALLLAIALYFGFETGRDEVDAARRLAQSLHWNPARFAGTTQALLLPKNLNAPGMDAAATLLRLCEHLRHDWGLRWRYRQPWLLLTGDDATIERLLPELAAHNWLVTQDAVLLWSKQEEHGLADENWLNQLYTLRRRRPVDAVIVTLDGTTNLPTQRRGTGAYSVNLARIAATLRWSAPVYVLDVAQTDSVTQGATPVIGCEFPVTADARSIEAALLGVRNRLVERSVAQLSLNADDRYAAELSQRLDTRSAPLADWIEGFAKRQRHQPISGTFFAPYPAENRQTDEGLTSADLPLWHYLGQASRSARGRRIGWHPVTVFSTAALIAIGVWTAGMLASGLSNARDLQLASHAVGTLNTVRDSASRLRALLALQQQITRYEDRTEHHTPLLTRFGLNHDNNVLAALWPAYAQASKRTLTDPLQQNLEAQLVDLSQMQTSRVDDQINQLALDGHKALKTYLMMSNPSRAD